MVGNVTIQGQITGTATFDGAKISAVVTIAPPINATVNFGGGISTIEQLPDPISDSSNIYGWIRSTLLTGLSELADSVIASGDTILQAFSKLQGQINAVKVRLGLLEDKLIYTVTLTEPPVTVTINLDKNGNTFSLTECEVHIYMPQASSNRTHSLVINNSEGGNVTSGVNFDTAGFVQYISAFGGYCVHRIKYNSNAQQVFCESIGQRYNTATTSASTIFYGFSKNPITHPIHTIDLVSASAVPWPVGTVISVFKK